MQLQPFQRLYSNLYLGLVQLWPGECDSRIVNMVYRMMGIWGARSVQTGRIAAHVPVVAKKMSIVWRLERFLANGAIRVRRWYEPIAQNIIATASAAGEIHLVLDTTKVSAYHRLLIVCVAYRRRALPLAWTWVRSSRGHSSTHKQVALLNYVRSMIPAVSRSRWLGIANLVTPPCWKLCRSGRGITRYAKVDRFWLSCRTRRSGYAWTVWYPNAATVASSARSSLPPSELFPPTSCCAGTNAIQNRGCLPPI